MTKWPVQKHTQNNTKTRRTPRRHRKKTIGVHVWCFCVICLIIRSVFHTVFLFSLNPIRVCLPMMLTNDITKCNECFICAYLGCWFHNILKQKEIGHVRYVYRLIWYRMYMSSFFFVLVYVERGSQCYIKTILSDHVNYLMQKHESLRTRKSIYFTQDSGDIAVSRSNYFNYELSASIYYENIIS